MRIVYLVRTTIPSPAANSIQTVRMCHAFAEAGHDVTLVAFDVNPEQRVTADWADYYGVRARFECRRITLPRVRGAEWIAIRALAAALALKRSATVYTRYLRLAAVTSRFGIPTAWEAHRPIDPNKIGEENDFRDFLHGHGFLSLITISSSLAEHYSKHYRVSKRRICVAPDGADASVERNDGHVHDHGTEGRRLRAGYAGNLYEGKGMEMIACLSRRCPQFEFHVAGGTESDRAYWQAQLASVANVKFHGSLAPAEVASFLQDMDVLLAPYQRIVRAAGGKRDIAGWMSPLKIFEYMSVGRPMIASDLDVLREVLGEHNAILCSPDDVEEWAEALGALESDPEYARALGASAEAHFEANFTWGARARRIIDHLASQGGGG